MYRIMAVKGMTQNKTKKILTLKEEEKVSEQFGIKFSKTKSVTLLIMQNNV